jgi:hypothetical protein
MKNSNRTSKAELRAICIIAAVVGLAIVIPHLSTHLFRQSTPNIVVPDVSVVEGSESEGRYEKYPKKKSRYPERKQKKWDNRKNGFKSAQSKDEYKGYRNTERSIICRPFDPNNAEADTLLAMGIRKYVVDNFLRYRSAGGKFMTR